jgi:hypothetical protein
MREIGKSLFLKFALLQALKARIPTIFCVEEPTYTLFDETGVRKCSIESTYYVGKVLALCDSNDKLTVPPPPFRGEESQAYIVQATSPLYTRYHDWQKHRQPSVVLMNGWEQQEANDLL